MGYGLICQERARGDGAAGADGWHVRHGLVVRHHLQRAGSSNVHDGTLGRNGRDGTFRGAGLGTIGEASGIRRGRGEASGARRC